jgi:hypothetical protein
VFRPLSQRIRESGPIRLLLDNRLVRHLADKPVTEPPTRRQAVLIGVVPGLACAIIATVWFFLAAYATGEFTYLGWITIVVLLLGGLLIGRRLRSVICTILATGLFFVFIISGAALVVSDYVLVSRGEEVPAVVGDPVLDPTGCAAVSAFHSRVSGRTSARLVHRPDGTPLPGAIGLGDRSFGSRHTYRKGEQVTVLVDPQNAMCMRAKSDVHPVVDTVITILAAGCIAWVFVVAPLDWRIRRRAKYETWRDHAA